LQQPALAEPALAGLTVVRPAVAELAVAGLTVAGLALAELARAGLAVAGPAVAEVAELAQAGLAVGEKAATAAPAAAIDPRHDRRRGRRHRSGSVRGEGSYRALPAKKS